jgi:hypothetical protein
MASSSRSRLPFGRRRRRARTAAPDPELAKTLRRIEKSVVRLTKQTATKAERRVAMSDPGFREVLASMKGHETTRLTRARLCTLWQAARNVAPLAGAAAEVGSYRGGSAYFIAASFRALLGHEIPVEVIDTFEGHPQDKLSERDAAMHRDDPTRFADTSYEQVAAYLAEFERVTVHKGEFSRVAPTLPEQAYRLAHVDVDLYEPAVECLDYFAPRLVAGGVIVLDDHGSPSCPGIEQAAAEFMDATDGFQAWDYQKQLVLVKSAAAAVSIGAGAADAATPATPGRQRPP